MTIIQAAHLLEGYAFNHAHKSLVGSARGQVCWRIKEGGWYSLRWCRVTQNDSENGLLRFRNDDTSNIIKKVWPFDIPTQEEVGYMKITVHESEIKELIPLIYEMATDPKKTYSSPLFPEGIICPAHCWSIKADSIRREAFEDAEARRIKRGK